MIGQTQKDYSLLSDMQLKQAMMFAQRSNNTPEFLQLMTEANKRKQMRQAATGEQAGQQLAQGPQTQADAVMSGIANLATPSDEQGYASGGIVAFDDGGLTTAQKVPTTVGGGYVMYKGTRMAVDTLRQLAALEGKTLAQMLASDTGAVAAKAAPVAVPAAVAAGGAGLSALGANYLNRLPDEQLDVLSNAGGGDDTGLAAAIIRNADRDMSGGRRAAAPAAQKTTPRVEPRDKPYINPQTYREYKGVSAPPPPPANGGAAGAGGSATRVGKTATTATAPAAVPDEKAPEYTAPSLAKLLADRKQAAAEGEAGIKALMDPYAAKIEERRKALAGETASTAGLLGLKADWFGDDKRRALRNFGLALMAGKDPNAMVNIGTAGKAAAEAYEAEKEKRQARMDALDDRDQKLALARYEMSRGNRDEADRLVKQVEEGNYRVHGSKMDAFKERMRQLDSARDRDLRREEMAQRERLGMAQINATTAAANRTPAEMLAVERIMKDKGVGFTEALGIYKQTAQDPRTNSALMLEMLKDPLFKMQNPELYEYYKRQLLPPPKPTNVPVGGVRQ